MAYNEKLAERVRDSLADQKVVEEKKMMGGLVFMVNGKMCVGVLKEELMVRLAPEVYEIALRKEGCREMNFTGKPMKGFVFVNQKGTNSENDFNSWIRFALDFNQRAKASIKKKRGSQETRI